MTRVKKQTAQPQKHVLRTVDDVDLESIANELMIASYDIEGSPLILLSDLIKKCWWQPMNDHVDEGAHFKLYPLCNWQAVKQVFHKVVSDMIKSETSREHLL